ncbi:hypothetical protein BS17DRAFT_784558, partial [Gyrodon lividus]
MVELLLKKGDKVVATLRKPAQRFPSHSRRPGKLLGRIDVVFNNAGQSMMGEVESVPEENARRLFDVNLWGAANVSRKPHGSFEMLLQVSSGVGIVGAPATGFYSVRRI